MRDKTIEEYCRLIHKLDGGKGVRSIDIARTLRLSRNTVAATLHKLIRDKYVSMEKYGPINLTKKGILVARRMHFRHRVIETFLHDVLRMDKEKIHEEACILEHAASDELVERLYSFLGKPKKDPHGTRIEK